MVIQNGLSSSKNIRKTDYENAKTVYEMFEEYAAKSPDKIALVFKDKTLTYKELNTKSNQLARILRANSVKPNDVVAVLVNRSLEMIITIIAVMKAGGAYLPVDPEYPSDRIDFMLKDCDTRILLTQKHLKDQIKFEGKIILCDDDNIYTGTDSNLEKVNKLNDLIYVIYTSGSTGMPKGTLIEHKSIINLINGMKELIDFSEDKTILSLASFAFDMSKPEILLPLTQGMRIVIADEEQKNNPKYLNDCIVKNNVDMLQITPSRLQLMFNYGKSNEYLKGLKELMIGAEPFPRALLEKMQEITPARIYNLYGPTETTVWSTGGELTHSSSVDVGTPILNTQIFILDNNEQLCSQGEEGELCISGDGLARGYLNRPELTDEKFVQNTFIPGERMYKTGDLARILPNGNIEILGRIDNQVKLNGRRIELGEIEYHIIKYGTVKEAAVILNDNCLCAYFVSETDIDADSIKTFLHQFLPPYMVPAYYIKIDRIPLSFNGKVDKKALQQIPLSNDSTSITDTDDQNSSMQTTEMRLRRVLSENIRTKAQAMEISLNDPITNTGIDSVAFVKLLVNIEMEFGIEFDDQYLDFRNLPTLAKILSYIEEALC